MPATDFRPKTLTRPPLEGALTQSGTVLTKVSSIAHVGALPAAIG
jgi:hypothetical protein